MESLNQKLERLDKLSDDELEKEVLTGVNIHLDSSDASVAKRILDNRRMKHQGRTVEHLEKTTQQLKDSHEELVKMSSRILEIIKLLQFFEKFLPNQPWYVKLSSFLFLTVILGLLLNIAATAITHFLLHW